MRFAREFTLAGDLWKKVAPALCFAACTGAAAGCGGAGATTSSNSVQQPSPAAASTTEPIGTTGSFPDLIDRVRSGVVRIEVETCTGSGVGTGIVLGPRQIATVEHVVDGATGIRIMRGGRLIATAKVIGNDRARDLALLRTSKPITGHRFQLAPRGARLGDSIAALGYPLGLPFTVTRGSVSGLNRTIPIDGFDRRRLVQTDAAVNPGNSGGPLIAVETGQVVGLVDLGSDQANGLAFAVSAQVARLLLEAWQASPQPIAPEACAPPPAPPAPPAPAPSAPRSGVPAIYAGHFASVDGREQCFTDGKYALCNSLISRETVSIHVRHVASYDGRMTASARGSRMPEGTSFTTPNGLISCESGRFGIHCVDNTQEATGFYLGDRYARIINDGEERRI